MVAGTRRRLLLAPMALAGLMMVGVAAPAAAQEAASPAITEGATIEVMGIGDAEAEASGAILQLVVRAQFMSEATVEPVKGGMGSMPAVTDEQIERIVAVLQKAGIAGEKIATLVQAAGPMGGLFGPGTAVIAAELNAAQLGELPGMVERAFEAGTDAGVIFDVANAAYLLDDCKAVEQAAVAAAVADGREQAEAMAAALGVTLGGLQKAVKQPSYGTHYAGGGAPNLCGDELTLEDGLRTYFPTFDPTRVGEVELYAQVLLTFGIA